MVTIKDIAAILQVSPSTVGRALADDRRISAEMKRKVNEAAAQAGYVANRAARMMRGVQSNLVGLIVPDIRNSFYSTIAHALSRCLLSANYQLTLCETDDDRMHELRHIKELTSANVAGIILVPSAKPHPDSARILKMTPHIQLLRKAPLLGDQWFGIDDRRALYESTEHIINEGHKRIAYIGGTEELPTGAARVQGFREAVKSSGQAITVREELGAPSSPEFGREAVRRLLSLKDRPTALVIGAVQNTSGVIDELQDQALSIPQDISVIGFGDELGYRWWGPGLTTVQLPVSELATACGLWFLHHLQNKSDLSKPYSFISPPQLIVRGSTATPSKQ
ncbi:LacI family DNA-binding transcriptional regulator (plasmid) [Rhizobium sp. CB3171]|uniref:LacI family DNA-binding transcriptional regulator n=1 Tax=unclassified Rhizobium TaxID=2613769 RepID=UPI000CDF319D|nr:MULTISPECIES: LacI family DNA-binding transcriptional regulator [Rhizobium]AVA26486.1 LacI family transcriptional regulator protein [Rhizobium sp. NXC24]UWU24129.1 LacI family transcriptional regulator [Rhizobium tropici]WFU05051.1 LacI family DNA-binding transcriptional regulator [Rhizobium sp. CB3171]